METAIALCFEHPSTRFAFVYARRRSPREIQDMVNRMEVAASMYGNQLGKVNVLPVNGFEQPERQTLILFPRTVVERSILEKLILSLFRGTTVQEVAIAWTDDAQKVGEALEVLKKVLERKP